MTEAFVHSQCMIYKYMQHITFNNSHGMTRHHVFSPLTNNKVNKATL